MGGGTRSSPRERSWEYINKFYFKVLCYRDGLAAATVDCGVLVTGKHAHIRCREGGNSITRTQPLQLGGDIVELSGQFDKISIELPGTLNCRVFVQAVLAFLVELERRNILGSQRPQVSIGSHR
mgnify:CR=1 FL=1